MTPIIRVMIVDDHDIVRNGLKMLLQTSDTLVFAGEATDGAQAVKLYESIRPDVVLMDLLMPGMSGVHATHLIREIDPNCRIVALTSFHEPELIQAALQAGATSYIVKNISIDELAAAIEAAYGGNSTLIPEAMQILVSALQPLPILKADLTRRESDILNYLVEGLNNQEIAGQMFLSQSTIKKHISSLFIKLKVTNRVEAITLALQHKLINV